MQGGNTLSRFWRKFGRSGADAKTAKRPDGNLRTPPTPAQTKVPAHALGKILVVDDDLIIQQTVRQAVEKRGYQVSVAGDISVALGLVRLEKPDLILLDLTFPLNVADVVGPVHNGFFVIEWLQHATGPKKIPIIIISGTDPAEYKAQISTAGIIACFCKPLDHGALLAAIDGALGRSRWGGRA